MGARQTIFENPVINSPVAERARPFRFSGEGITNEIAAARRESACFIAAVNGRSAFGRWAFVAITGPWDTMNTLCAAITSQKFKSSP